jgi:hypothetical protein
MKKERILIFAIFLLTIILINLFLISAADPFRLSDYINPDVLIVLFALLPAIILFLFSIIAIRKGSRTLVSLQLFLWWIYLLFVGVKVYAYLDIYLNLGFMSKDLINKIVDISLVESSNAYLLAIVINAIVAFYMSFYNSKVVKILGGINR